MMKIAVTMIPQRWSTSVSNHLLQTDYLTQPFSPYHCSFHSGLSWASAVVFFGSYFLDALPIWSHQSIAASPLHLKFPMLFVPVHCLQHNWHIEGRHHPLRTEASPGTSSLDLQSHQYHRHPDIFPGYLSCNSCHYMKESAHPRIMKDANLMMPTTMHTRIIPAGRRPGSSQKGKA